VENEITRRFAARLREITSPGERYRAREAAIKLAIEERTGVMPDSAIPFTTADAARAEEILKACWPEMV
jgi:hypothetical protein